MPDRLSVASLFYMTLSDSAYPEVHAPEEGSGSNDHGDGREDELEIHHGRLWVRCADVCGWQSSLARESVE